MCGIAFATSEADPFSTAVLAYQGTPNSQLGVVDMGIVRPVSHPREAPLSSRQWQGIPGGTNTPLGHPV